MEEPKLIATLGLCECCKTHANGTISTENASSLAAQLKALSDPARITILSMVATSGQREDCVCNFTEALGLSQATISHHLKILLTAGYLEREKRGTWAYYKIVPGSLSNVAEKIKVLTGQ